MRLAIIGGVFDNQGGRKSGYVERLKAAVESCTEVILYANGGHWENLEYLVNGLGDVDAVLWFADVPNELPKLVASIKAQWPKIYLVTSKRNLDGKYPMSEVLGRALKVKANLTVEMTGKRAAVESTVLDPLGSAYCLRETNIERVADVLFQRLDRISKFKRVGSEQVGDRVEPPNDPELQDFYALIRDQAERFHAIIHGVGHERMMGNASFRCAKGFPSFREDGLIYVSQRDVDKRYIGPDAFVAVTASVGKVSYLGLIKPSVDTPIQLQLYNYYGGVKYMLHSHTYIEGAPYTSEPIPCGAVEEASEVFKIEPSHSGSDFAVNLRGHGSIVLASKLDTLRNQPWCPRPVPELYPAV